MKKLISLILVAVMTLTFVTPAVAITNSETNINASRSKIPVIRISGDGAALYNKEGERIMHFRGLLDSFKGDGSEDDSSSLYESMANVLLPFLVDGLLFDEWGKPSEGNK